MAIATNSVPKQSCISPRRDPHTRMENITTCTCAMAMLFLRSAAKCETGHMECLNSLEVHGAKALLADATTCWASQPSWLRPLARLPSWEPWPYRLGTVFRPERPHFQVGRQLSCNACTIRLPTSLRRSGRYQLPRPNANRSGSTSGWPQGEHVGSSCKRWHAARRGSQAH